MVAITMLTVSFLGISSLLAQSLALSRVTANSVTATYLASEGIEVAKNLIDHDFYGQASGETQGWGSCFGGGGNFELTYATYDCVALTQFIGQGDYLWYHNSTDHLYDYDQNGTTETGFTRKIVVTPAENGNRDEITVDAIVTWAGFSGVSNDIKLEDTFYKWY
jgi:hypothetical protein